MWYEAIPSAIIVGGFLSVTQLLHRYVHPWLFEGNMYRKINNPFDRKMYLRDYRVHNGRPPFTKLLDDIPDE